MKQSERKRAAILQAAKEEFLSQGVRNTSMDQVAERAQVSKRTVYNHFENKEALFRAVSVELCTMARTVPVTYDPTTPLETQLLELATQEVAVLTSDSYVSAFRALLVESFELPGIVDQIAVELSKEQDALGNWISAAMADGRLSCTDIDQASLHFHTLIKGAFFWPVVVGFGAPVKEHERQAYLQQTVEMFLSYYQTTN